tara:strand:+ start:2748 stop:3173 length:426 start_codon:yes stop_codon:yes gene_type:complete
MKMTLQQIWDEFEVHSRPTASVHDQDYYNVDGLIEFGHELHNRAKELDERQYKLAYAMAGGEDTPGLLDTVSTEDLIKMMRQTQDIIISNERWEAKISGMEYCLAIAERVQDTSQCKDCNDTVKIREDIEALIKEHTPWLT